MADVDEIPDEISTDNKPKTWVETMDPVMKRWKLRSLFPDCTSSIDAEESADTYEQFKILTELLDAHWALYNKAVSQFKWHALYGCLMGISGSKLIDYLTS